ncbi:MAG: hypothetical protein MR874_02635 [Coriobacteriaceae bacterium]|nr:hypothetical protein [Coriobacteriaceae bacterium]MDD7584009.1 hypothetical protein [Coriobacteriaceae bacterium]
MTQIPLITRTDVHVIAVCAVVQFACVSAYLIYSPEIALVNVMAGACYAKAFYDGSAVFEQLAFAAPMMLELYLLVGRPLSDLRERGALLMPRCGGMRRPTMRGVACLLASDALMHIAAEVAIIMLMIALYGRDAAIRALPLISGSQFLSSLYLFFAVLTGTLLANSVSGVLTGVLTAMVRLGSLFAITLLDPRTFALVLAVLPSFHSLMAVHGLSFGGPVTSVGLDVHSYVISCAYLALLGLVALALLLCKVRRLDVL